MEQCFLSRTCSARSCLGWFVFQGTQLTPWHSSFAQSITATTSILSLPPQKQQGLKHKYSCILPHVVCNVANCVLQIRFLGFKTAFLAPQQPIYKKSFALLQVSRQHVRATATVLPQIITGSNKVGNGGTMQYHHKQSAFQTGVNIWADKWCFLQFAFSENTGCSIT